MVAIFPNIKSHNAKDIHDVGASPLIEISKGAKSDLRLFYSTTNSTTYQGQKNTILESPINGVNAKDLKLKPTTSLNSTKSLKLTSGYTNNINSFVKYDKMVDEGQTFRFA